VENAISGQGYIPAMEQLLPTSGPIGSVLDLLADDPRPTPAGRPWVAANMVASVDGAYGRDGRSAGLSGEADRTVFRALRACADVILVAAGTARTERYRRPVDAGTTSARLAMVSRSLDLPADQPCLSGSGPEPIVYHPSTADAGRLPPGVEPRAVGGTTVDIPAMLADLYADGARMVLCEGGPNLLGQLADLDVIDELFVTLSPLLVGGEQVGLLGGHGPMHRGLSLHRVLRDEGSLFLTYRSGS
jgi:riboflavin biosynthesis pyrimidine reductase